MPLLAASSSAWLECVMENFDSFLIDHASAERKASAMALSFIVKYPDKPKIHLPLIRLAREELLHFQQVMELILARELVIGSDKKDGYLQQLLQHLSPSGAPRFLDRLLLGGVVEARGVERFNLVGEHHPNHEMKLFYKKLSISESHHETLFPDLARYYFKESEIEARQQFWWEREAEAMQAMPIHPFLH